MQALVLHSLFEVHSVMLVPDELSIVEDVNELAEYYNQSVKLVDVVNCNSIDEVLEQIKSDNGEGEGICEQCGKACEYHPDVCLCDECLAKIV